jgi:hypothetical protein
VDLVRAAEGVVCLLERIWPAFEAIDTSSGALGIAVNRAQEQLLPMVAEAPADRKTRDAWLERLWDAICEDGVSYLAPVEDYWGELCGSADVASHWADELLPLLRSAWADSERFNYVQGSSLCLASLVAAGRHGEVLEVLALERHPIWSYRRFGVAALLAQGRTDDALAYAEASRGLNSPESTIDAVCERILLNAGRTDEAYKRYALTANRANTGLATFRQVAKKYPQRDAKQILLDLAGESGDAGRWFAAAKDAGILDLALEFARAGQTDPRTLSRASRDLLSADAVFCLRVGRLAVERMLNGDGYDLTGADVMDACDRFLAAAARLGFTSDAKADLERMVEKLPPQGVLFRDAVRRCLGRSPGPAAG